MTLQQSFVSVLGRFVLTLSAFSLSYFCVIHCERVHSLISQQKLCKLQCSLLANFVLFEKFQAELRKSEPSIWISCGAMCWIVFFSDFILFVFYFCWFSYSLPFCKAEKNPVCVFLYCAILRVRKMFVKCLFQNYFPLQVADAFFFQCCFATFHGCNWLQRVIYLMCKIYFHESFLNVPAILFLLASCTPERTLSWTLHVLVAAERRVEHFGIDHIEECSICGAQVFFSGRTACYIFGFSAGYCDYCARWFEGISLS